VLETERQGEPVNELLAQHVKAVEVDLQALYDPNYFLKFIPSQDVESHCS
jgi:hypothetical protein